MIRAGCKRGDAVTRMRGRRSTTPQEPRVYNFYTQPRFPTSQGHYCIPSTSRTSTISTRVTRVTRVTII